MKKKCVGRIALTLFEKHKYDPEYALAIAYYHVHKKIITWSYGQALTNLQKTKHYENLTSEEVEKMREDYCLYMTSGTPC